MMEMRHTIDTTIHFFFIAPGSCQMEGITGLYNYISGYLSGILSFVTVLLLLVIIFHLDGYRHIKQFFKETKEDFINWMRYVRSWTHSTALELVWTIIPTAILVAIGIPSFILLYSLDEIVDCQVVVKIIAYQWYWKYEYPVNFHEDFDVLNVEVLSYMRPNTDLTDYLPLRLLEVDMPLVLPHSVNVKLIITSKDVLHSFAVPALGIKMDAVPGRLNQVTVFITQPGVYYGQCSELCGVNHAFMPITIHAISFELYEQFLIKIAIAQEADKIAIAMEKFFATEGHLFLDEPSDNDTEEDSSEPLNESSEETTTEPQESIESNSDTSEIPDFCHCKE